MTPTPLTLDIEAWIHNEIRRGDNVRSWYVCLKRYHRLDGIRRQIADVGIKRYMRACERSEVALAYDAVLEIVTDAERGLAVYADKE